jgi:hypothetical protein
MKVTKISFRVFDESGPLSVYFYPGPYGDALEAQIGDGVGWFSSSTHELLGVEFDDVLEKADHQILKFKSGWAVEVKVKKGQVTFKSHPPRKKKSDHTQKFP